MITNYRAWHKEMKKMLEVTLIDFRKEEVNTILGQYRGTRYSYDAFGQVEVTQGIGLKDNNKKEIFDGDIVKISCWESRKHYKDAKKKDCEGIFLIEKVLGTFGYRFNFKNIKGYPNAVHLGVSNKDTIIKVIGNKFQKPKLLEDK